MNLIKSTDEYSVPTAGNHQNRDQIKIWNPIDQNPETAEWENNRKQTASSAQTSFQKPREYVALEWNKNSFESFSFGCFCFVLGSFWVFKI